MRRKNNVVSWRSYQLGTDCRCLRHPCVDYPRHRAGSQADFASGGSSCAAAGPDTAAKSVPSTSGAGSAASTGVRAGAGAGGASGVSRSLQAAPAVGGRPGGSRRDRPPGLCAAGAGIVFVRTRGPRRFADIFGPAGRRAEPPVRRHRRPDPGDHLAGSPRPAAVSPQVVPPAFRLIALLPDKCGFFPIFPNGTLPARVGIQPDFFRPAAL